MCFSWRDWATLVFMETKKQSLLGLPNSGRSRRNNNALRHYQSRRLYASPPAVEGAPSAPPGSRGMRRVETGEDGAMGRSAPVEGSWIRDG